VSAFYSIVAASAAVAALVAAYFALLAVRRLRRELAAVRRELAGASERAAGAVRAATAELLPAARAAERDERSAEIRSAVAEALAEERERELAEARAFWAAHEAREAAGAPGYDPALEDRYYEIGEPGEHGDSGDHDGSSDAESPGDAAYLDVEEFQVLPLLPRQVDRLTGGDAEPPAGPRYRHPSDPDFAPSPVVADPEQTVARLTELAEAGTPLADVRPGPLGTLDLYIFTDGTTLCLTPGHTETADRLAAALARGEVPVLMGGSGISGAYALTFTYGTESVFILADRVVASL
jgi:hypothetical protein